MQQTSQSFWPLTFFFLSFWARFYSSHNSSKQTLPEKWSPSPLCGLETSTVFQWALGQPLLHRYSHLQLSSSSRKDPFTPCWNKLCECAALIGSFEPGSGGQRAALICSSDDRICPAHCSAIPAQPPRAAKLAATHLSCNKSFKLLIVWSPKKCKPKDYAFVSCSLASGKRISAELWSNCIHYCYLFNSTLGILVAIIYIKVMNLISQYINKKHLIWVKNMITNWDFNPVWKFTRLCLCKIERNMNRNMS